MGILFNRSESCAIEYIAPFDLSILSLRKVTIVISGMRFDHAWSSSDRQHQSVTQERIANNESSYIKIQHIYIYKINEEVHGEVTRLQEVGETVNIITSILIT